MEYKQQCIFCGKNIKNNNNVFLIETYERYVWVCKKCATFENIMKLEILKILGEKILGEEN